MLPASDVHWPSECGESGQGLCLNPLWANEFLGKSGLNHQGNSKKRLQDEDTPQPFLASYFGRLSSMPLT